MQARVRVRLSGASGRVRVDGRHRGVSQVQRLAGRYARPEYGRRFGCLTSCGQSSASQAGD